VREAARRRETLVQLDDAAQALTPTVPSEPAAGITATVALTRPTPTVPTVAVASSDQ
jgi:hypothetical protein